VKFIKKITVNHFSTVQRPVCVPQFDNRCANKHSEKQYKQYANFSASRAAGGNVKYEKISNWMFQQVINLCRALDLKRFLTFINNTECP